MRERAQASVETIALMAAVAALTAVLLLGVVRLGPSLASALDHALSSILVQRAPAAPHLDDLERSLLAGATSAAADGPTLLDVRTRLRSRLGRTAADAAFGAIVRPLVAHTLEASSIASDVGTITVVDRATEDAWVRDRLHAGRAQRVADLAGTPGAMAAMARHLDLGVDVPADAFPAGRAAGDIVAHVSGGGYSQVVLRRRPDRGLVVILALLAGGGPAYAGRR
jgi:hypothetical protein